MRMRLVGSVDLVGLVWLSLFIPLGCGMVTPLQPEAVGNGGSAGAHNQDTLRPAPNSANCLLAADEYVVNPRDGNTKLCQQSCSPIKTSVGYQLFCAANCKNYRNCIVLPIIDSCSKYDTFAAAHNQTCGAICVQEPDSHVCTNRNSSCSAISDCYWKKCSALAANPTTRVNGGVCSGASSPSRELTDGEMEKMNKTELDKSRYDDSGTDATMTLPRDDSSDNWILVTAIIVTAVAVCCAAFAIVFSRFCPITETRHGKAAAGLLANSVGNKKSSSQAAVAGNSTSQCDSIGGTPCEEDLKKQAAKLTEQQKKVVDQPSEDTEVLKRHDIMNF